MWELRNLFASLVNSLTANVLPERNDHNDADYPTVGPGRWELMSRIGKVIQQFVGAPIQRQQVRKWGIVQEPAFGMVLSSIFMCMRSLVTVNLSSFCRIDAGGPAGSLCR
jgi:hypothetical protein